MEEGGECNTEEEGEIWKQFSDIREEISTLEGELKAKKNLLSAIVKLIYTTDVKEKKFVSNEMGNFSVQEKIPKKSVTPAMFKQALEELSPLEKSKVLKKVDEFQKQAQDEAAKHPKKMLVLIDEEDKEIQFEIPRTPKKRSREETYVEEY